MKVEVDVLGSPSLTIRTVSVYVKQHWNIAPELRSCVKVEADVLGVPSLTVLMGSVDVKQHWNICVKAQELCGLDSPFLIFCIVSAYVKQH